MNYELVWPHMGMKCETEGCRNPAIAYGHCTHHRYYPCCGAVRGTPHEHNDDEPERHAIKREDWALLLICQAEMVLDNQLLPRLLYILSQEIQINGEFFEFTPGYYGPYSNGFLQLTDRLRIDGLIVFNAQGAPGPKGFTCTRKGFDKAYEIAELLPEHRLEYISKLVEWGQGLGWMAVSRAVCKKWPKSGGSFFEHKNG
jgi:hypothetical protein